MKIIKITLISIFGLIIIYFVYQAFRISYLQVGEVDSLTYHIPLAEHFASGNFTNLFSIKQGLGFYPGMSEVFLSLFILLRLPLGLFNVLGLMLLFLVCKRLGESFELNRDYSTIFSVSIASLPTIIRLVPAQTIDIWLAIFFVWALTLLNQPRKDLRYFLLLGLSLGLLIGTKYSGILLALGLLILYIKKINLFLNFKRLMILIIPIIIFGLSWYIRNYIITGNPVYPVPFFGFNGDPNYLSLTWTSWSVITKTSNGLWLMLQSFLSEYIFWSLSPFIILFLYFRFRRKKDLSLFNKYSGLIILSGINLLIFLPQPSWPILQITMSNMRFLYPMVIPLTLLVFILFKKISKEVLLAIIAVLSSVSFLPQLSFYPKLLLIWLLISFVFLFRYL